MGASCLEIEGNSRKGPIRSARVRGLVFNSGGAARYCTLARTLLG
jgi:hypothetical protein